MDRQDFIQSSTTTRVYEKDLLTENFFDRMAETEDLAGAVRLLNDTGYQSYFNKLSRPQDYEKALKEALQDVYKKYNQMLKDPEVLKLLTMKYQYHNLKVMLKEKISGHDFSDMFIDIGNFDFEELREDFESGDRTQLDSRYADVINKVYDDYLDKKDPQLIDVYTDRAFFKDMKRISEKLDVKMFKQYVEDLIDFTNVKTLLRVQKQDVDINFLDEIIILGGTIDVEKFKANLYTKIDENSPLIKSARIYYYLKESIKDYNNTNSLSAFEKSMDDYIVSLIKEAKKVTFGPEVPFAYIMAKENEIKNLRIVLVSKNNNLPKNFIKERLRETYA
ncbi:MAG: V-type ATP synthase subunit C [Lagierella massiliensis]|nr:V-type ATP synthase subunit C [Lagierella massiliensis]